MQTKQNIIDILKNEFKNHSGAEINEVHSFQDLFHELGEYMDQDQIISIVMATLNKM